MVTIASIDAASNALKDLNLVGTRGTRSTSLSVLEKSDRLSDFFKANIYLKREDQLVTRSFKLRGAYNKISNLTNYERQRGVVCCSAGNHAQGVAYSCNKLKIHGVIFMPSITTKQKIERVAYLGKEYVQIRIEGKSLEESKSLSANYAESNNMIYVHPYDDPMVISGQGTIGKEIIEQLDQLQISSGEIVILVPIGGGGLIAGIATYIKEIQEKTKVQRKIRIIGIEPVGAASMKKSIEAGRPFKIPDGEMDTFADGVAVARPGDLSFKLCKKYVDDIILVDNKSIAKTMIDMYQNEGIVLEPAGSLGISALPIITADNSYDSPLTIVCVISGGNNDIYRYTDIIKRASD